MKTSTLLGWVWCGAVATFIVTVFFRDWLRKRRIVATLSRRTQRDDERFSREFYPDPKRSKIAIRVRRVLARNLEMRLTGLMPQDHLENDLDAELPANPHLFWELEAEFGITTDVEDMEAHEKSLVQLVTFQNLVEYVEQKMADRTSESMRST
jgi:acyl carrier protein